MSATKIQTHHYLLWTEERKLHVPRFLYVCLLHHIYSWTCNAHSINLIKELEARQVKKTELERLSKMKIQDGGGWKKYNAF